MKSKHIILITIFLTITIGCYIYALPFIKVKQIKDTLKNKDTTLLSEYIDFPLLRENIKSQLKASFIKEMQNDEEIQNNPFSGLGMGLSFIMIDKTIDTFLTSSGIQAIIKNNEKSFDLDTSLKKYNYTVDMYYKSLRQFHIFIKSNDVDKNNIQFILKRKGLSWQLTGVDLSQFPYFVNMEEHERLRQEEKQLLEEQNRLRGELTVLVELQKGLKTRSPATFNRLEAEFIRWIAEEERLSSEYKRLAKEANILFAEHNSLNLIDKLFENQLMKKGNSLFAKANHSLAEVNRLGVEFKKLLTE